MCILWSFSPQEISLLIGTLLLKQRAKSIRPGMRLRIEDPPTPLPIPRSTANPRSSCINNRMDELDRRGTDTWKVARKERIDGPLLQLQAPAGLHAWMVKS